MRKAYRITGKVQGVGYRWFTRETATGLGLRGTVRNLDDGSVEVTADGDPAALARLEARLRDGPRGARVEAIQAMDPPETIPEDFRIVR